MASISLKSKWASMNLKIHVSILYEMILKSFLSSFILRLVGFQDNVPKAKQEELNIKYQTCYEENWKILWCKKYNKYFFWWEEWVRNYNPFIILLLYRGYIFKIVKVVLTLKVLLRLQSNSKWILKGCSVISFTDFSWKFLNHQMFRWISVIQS